MTGEKEKIELTHFEESPWGKFLLSMARLDKTSETPDGWYWLIGLHYLLGITIKRIQDYLPDEHPLKTAPLPDIGEELVLKQIISELRQGLGNPKKINKIDFSNLKFKNFVNFSNLIFPIDVTFSNSEFYDKVHFDYTESFIYTSFSGACFFDTVQFMEARLSTTEFQKTLFYGFANFFNATFTKLVVFKGAIFFDFARFNDVIFLGRTDFSEVNFKNHPPHFYNAKPNADITWRNAKWPSMNIQTLPDLIDQNQSTYENLAYHMKTLEKYHDQHLFFREEMRCRRKIGSFFNSLLYGFYEVLADYGYGVGRALFWWFLHIILGAIAIFIIASCAGLGTQQALFCSTSTSFANANPFVFIGFKEGGLTDCYKVLHYLLPIEFGTIRGVQTFFGIPLLFILLATLRIRFRLK